MHLMQLILCNKLLNKSPQLKINRSLWPPGLSLTAGHMTGRTVMWPAVEGGQGLLFGAIFIPTTLNLTHENPRPWIQTPQASLGGGRRGRPAKRAAAGRAPPPVPVTRNQLPRYSISRNHQQLYLSCLRWGLDCTYHDKSVKSVPDNSAVPGLKMRARR